MAIYRGLPTILSPFCPLRWVWPRRSASACAGGRPEIVLLFAVGFFPAGWDIGANALVSFACAMQVQAFRKVHGYPFASTMCIGNLRSGMDALVAFGHTHDKNALWKSLHYFAIIFIFALGAGIGTQCVGIFGERTIWLSCALLLVSLCFMFIKEDLPEIEEELKK